MTVTKPYFRGYFIVYATVVFADVAGCASDSGVGPGDTTADAGSGADAIVGSMTDGGADATVRSMTDSGADAEGAIDSGRTPGLDASLGPDASGSDGASVEGAAGDSAAPAMLPCDIYGKAGTECVAAHSTTRALFAAYGSKLYQVQRLSDHATLDIGAMSPGGYANAASQDTFCAGTTCTITIIYDQSIQANHLTVSAGGGAASGDVGANAAILPALAGGNKVYGVYVSPGTGYRNLSAKGTAIKGQPEGMYMVTSGKHVNDGCCFDYGNTEQPIANDTGNGHMDAVYFGNRCEHPPCNGSGPWISADLENGLFQGNGSNTSDMPAPFDLVSAMLKNDGLAIFSLKTGNAQAGSLTTQYTGTLPTGSFAGYMPMSKEGGIVLGVGGDNSNRSAGDFYEGLMTYGYPTDAADNAVQANIVAVGYEVVNYTAIVPTSESAAQSWKYTTTLPASSWNQTSFDDSGWTTGNGGFGTSGTPGAVIGTTWSTADIWLRQSFTASALTTAQLSELILRLHHDESVEVYVNGVLATSLTGYVTSYGYTSMTQSAESAIVPSGNNVLAVHCNNTIGGQFVDVGIYRMAL
jgi:hypothetical protein